MSYEPSDSLLFLSSLAVLIVFVLSFFFGIWSRHYVFPTDTTLSLKQQIVAGVPVAFIAMGIYAKDAAPNLTEPHDYMISLGYAIVFGMMSRESLERLMRASGSLVEASPAASETTSEDEGKDKDGDVEAK